MTLSVGHLVVLKAKLVRVDFARLRTLKYRRALCLVQLVRSCRATCLAYQERFYECRFTFTPRFADLA